MKEIIKRENSKIELLLIEEKITLLDYLKNENSKFVLRTLSPRNFEELKNNEFSIELLDYFNWNFIADYGRESKKYLTTLWFPIVLYCIMLGICYWGRHDMMTFHIMFNYIFILPILVFFAYFRITMPKIPSWMGGTSFDVYLVHNKVLMSLRYFLGAVPLWAFAVVTLIATIIFYGLRKHLKI